MDPTMYIGTAERGWALSFDLPCKSEVLLCCVFLAMALIGFGPFLGTCSAEPPCKKEVPQITLTNISPPYKDYNYFQDSGSFPFEYDVSFFSLVNAWWLAEASTLVYADEVYVRERFAQAGFQRVKFFSRSSTQCFVASNNRFAMIVFRGSEIWKLGEPFDPAGIIADLKTNIDIRLSKWGRGKRVHSGFKAALDEVWDELLPEIDNLRARGLKIWVTGHSLGAALATLAADRLGGVQGLYTFGSPRVGDATFKDRFQSSVFRVVNGKDIVADVPPEGAFRHVGELKWISIQDGRQVREQAIRERDEAPCSDVPNPNGRTQEAARFNTGFLIPSPIRDHVPLLYAISLWNKLVESQESHENR